MRGLAGAPEFRHIMNRLETPDEQLAAVETYFAGLATRGDRLTYIEELAA